MNQNAVRIAEFWHKEYLSQYIASGGSKIKFLIGSRDTDKAAVLDNLAKSALALKYISVNISARNVWLNDFREIYEAVVTSMDFMSIISRYADIVISNMGYHPSDLNSGEIQCSTFADFLQEIKAFDPICKREIREQLGQMFLQNPRIDKNFALCCALLTGGVLGYPVLEPASQELLLRWVMADKSAKPAALRKLNMSPSKITKYNARHMLRSFVEITRAVGYTGLLVCIDDFDALLNSSASEEIHYTRLRREDVYESIRELIDDLDNMRHMMFVFAFKNDLIEDETAGIKSYQALWMRIQTEIESRRLNCFADIIDLGKPELEASEIGGEINA